jgi:hypothetical protein
VPSEELVVIRFEDQGAEQTLARLREIRRLLDELGGAGAEIGVGAAPLAPSGGAAVGLVNTAEAAQAVALARGPLAGLAGVGDLRQLSDQFFSQASADLVAGARDSLQRQLAGQFAAPSPARALAVIPGTVGESAVPLTPPQAAVLGAAGALAAAPAQPVAARGLAAQVGAAGPAISFAEIQGALAGVPGDVIDVEEVRRLVLARRQAAQALPALAGGAPAVAYAEPPERPAFVPRPPFIPAAGGGAGGRLPPFLPRAPGAAEEEEPPPPATPGEFAAARERLAGREPGRQTFSTFEIREEAARQRRAAAQLVPAGGGVGGGGGDDDQARLGRGRGRGAGGDERGFFEEFARTSFTPFIVGITAQQALAPFGAANQEILQAQRQFGPLDPARGRLDAERLDALIRLGRQSEEVQQRIDGVTNAFLRLGGDAGAGRLIGVMGSLSAAADAAAGPIVGITGTLLSLRALGVPAAALGAGAGLAAGVAAGGAFQFAGVEAGTRAAEAAGLPVAYGGPLANLLNLITPLATTIPAAQIGAGAIRGLAPTQFDQAVAFARGLPVVGGAVAGFQQAGILPGAPTEPDRLLAAGIPPAVIAIAGRQAEEARRAAAEPRIFAAEQEALGRAQEGLGLARARFAIGLQEQQAERARVRLDEQEAFERRRVEIGAERAAEDVGVAFRRELRDIDVGFARGSRDLGVQVGRAVRDVTIQARERREDVGIQAGFQREDIRRQAGISRRELGIGVAEAREDVDIGYREGLQDILLGQVGGVAGQFLRLGVQRQRALRGIGRDERRALGRLGREEEDALGSVGIGEGRALAGVDREERRALAGIGRGAGDAEADLRQRRQDALDDARQRREDRLDDIRTGRERARDDLREDQARRREQLEEQLRIAAALRAIQIAEIEARQKMVNDLTATAREQITQLDAMANAYRTHAGTLEDLNRRINEAASGMLEGALT